MEPIEQLRILLDVFIAVCLGGVLGYERETKDKPAGFRTNMFISGASALLIALGLIISNQMVNSLPHETIRIDPVRIIHGIILGVGFLGAGTIWKGDSNPNIKNLTTAAMLLFSVGIGIAVGLRVYILAAGVTLLGLFISNLLNRVMKKSYETGD